MASVVGKPTLRIELHICNDVNTVERLCKTGLCEMFKPGNVLLQPMGTECGVIAIKSFDLITS